MIPSVVESDPGGAVLVPRLPGRHQVFLAVLDPLQRGRELLRRQQHADVLAQGHDLLPEASADVAGDHPDPVLGQAEQARAEHPHLVRRLGRGPDGELAAGGRPLGDDAPRLHRHRRVGLLPDRLGDHVGGRVEDVRHRLGRRACQLAREVAGVVLMDEGLDRRRLRVVGHRRQRLVVDFHQLGRVLGQVAAVRDHERDRVAREPGLALGQRRARSVRHLVPCAGVPGLADVAVEVGGGEDGVHSGQVERGGHVNTDDPRPRVGAADEAGVQQARAGDVVDEGARARQQPRVLHPTHAAACVASRTDGGHRGCR